MSQLNPNKKRILKIVLIPIAIILAIAIAATALVLQPGNISQQEAIDIALAHVGGGNANWPERDFEDFQRAWSVEVFYDGLVHEVYISRFTGEIIRVEIDRWR
ncbi:MAG: PepSY domain-containing protein [Clostridiales bacterium]|jgi:hypothetical protein|nr:PepSY domain-containing protein [Clostridiales bacterium]